MDEEIKFRFLAGLIDSQKQEAYFFAIKKRSSPFRSGFKPGFEKSGDYYKSSCGFSQITMLAVRITVPGLLPFNLKNLKEPGFDNFPNSVITVRALK